MPEGVDLSPLHAAIDRLKNEMCSCGHTNECMACKGFEVVREQAQMVYAAASQPVLVQVAQEASVKDLMERLKPLQEKLTEDPKLQELMAEFMQRVQEDVGGDKDLKELLGGLGGERGTDEIPFEDRPKPPEK
jgi:ERCC4-related helicase